MRKNKASRSRRGAILALVLCLILVLVTSLSFAEEGEGASVPKNNEGTSNEADPPKDPDPPKEPETTDLTEESGSQEGGSENTGDSSSVTQDSSKPESGKDEEEPEKKKESFMGWSGVKPTKGGGMDVPRYYQTDYRDTLITIRGIPRSVASSGCGPTSLSMVIAYLTGDTKQNPQTIFQEGIDHGYYNGSGFSLAALARLASRHGVKTTRIGNSKKDLVRALKSGKPVIARMGPGIFTRRGHYVVLRGVTRSGNILLNDPYSPYKNGCEFPVQTILAQTKGSQPFLACSIDPAYFEELEEEINGEKVMDTVFEFEFEEEEFEEEYEEQYEDTEDRPIDGPEEEEINP